MMVYEAILYKSLSSDDFPQTDRYEVRNGSVFRSLDAAKEYGLHEMRYDLYMADDQPRWFDAVGVVSSFTGVSGVQYVQVRHLTVES